VINPLKENRLKWNGSINLFVFLKYLILAVRRAFPPPPTTCSGRPLNAFVGDCCWWVAIRPEEEFFIYSHKWPPNYFCECFCCLLAAIGHGDQAKDTSRE
jgi:hypothetical protein